ncbi:glycerol-3-phosphate acyltransferase, chloroplastic isoform X1 [Lycium barbarum]|uniref:glycerol-3-phosphate acyltransferase, chloroplastic isoform X1 n=2 Tax=Lycium barbarum TaxID=112863 RepID=UPI00293E77BA|nr:glycerol-3-phosphate acyltransferase, chloroplastic isoform X1 [Lycium barbarum]XP_060207671.1 glycerol-3-phosphate acyltransferase, chloroplastic isoform X1 [Lycium barbarum]XP_060207672.1 glycerol-3-phosphate acyltransferase, chloroplastic isoform X1 [Lycium barbarum]XP_060207673.1 glycerol-3-phosphate acyltransferase, chloroplastic isoform X1 [Lycium barbarum]
MLILSSFSSSSSHIPKPLSSFSSTTSCVPAIVKASAAVTNVCFAATSRLFPISCLRSSVKIRKLRCAVFCSYSTAAIAVSTSENHELPHSCAFLDARTGEDLLSAIRKAVEDEKLPLSVAEGMEELYHNYRNAVLRSGVPKADEIILYNMALVLDRVFVDVKDSFEFSPHHKAIREPFDYYTFGQNYIRPLVDFRSSYVGNISVFGEIEEKLKQGDNVVLMSNHQSEADPAIIALLLELKHPYIAENIIYVAGDRVITDPLCKPFSMGRNLLCVYSKKHMNDDPELAEMKKRANTRSLKEMALLLRAGSKIIWIAPSGGRDRPDAVTKEWYPAPFDASAADNMRRLVEHAGVPGHIYPLAILCHDIMPPPPQVEKNIREKRVISFHGTGISVAPKVDFHEVAGALEDSEAKMVYTKALYDSVNQQYNVLNAAIHGKQGLEASTPSVSLSQPWQ